jgi:hypothetical protein
MTEFVRDERFNGPKLYDVQIPNVECAYLYLFQPDIAFNDSKWKVTLFLNDQYANALAKVGFNVKTWKTKEGKEPSKYDGRRYIVATRKTHTKDGSNMYPPKVYEADGRTYWNKEVAIGNGSICNVIIAGKYMEIKGETVLPCYLQSVQVVQHEEYNSSPFSDVSGGDGNPDVPF